LVTVVKSRPARPGDSDVTSKVADGELCMYVQRFASDQDQANHCIGVDPELRTSVDSAARHKLAAG
jgi:hypothetical protein